MIESALADIIYHVENEGKLPEFWSNIACPTKDDFFVKLCSYKQNIKQIYGNQKEWD